MYKQETTETREIISLIEEMIKLSIRMHDEKSFSNYRICLKIKETEYDPVVALLEKKLYNLSYKQLLTFFRNSRIMCLRLMEGYDVYAYFAGVLHDHESR